jgi:TonB family protein
MPRGFRRIGIGLVLLALIAPTVQAAPRKVIQRPDWAAKPSGEDMARFFPKRAQDESVSGKATITCVVTAEGLLDRCGVIQEAPKGYGFGDAALALAPSFRMSPKRVDGQAVEGGEVTIPIVFNQPKDMPDLGDVAMILTKVGAGGLGEAAHSPMPCPDGQGECETHPLTWVARPDGKETARILGPVTPDAGTTYVACVVSASGLLENCELAGDVTPVTQAAALATIKSLKAPPKTADGLPTASTTVMILFPWEWLKLGSKEMAKRHPQTDAADVEAR